jgi:hypothetical protein
MRRTTMTTNANTIPTAVLKRAATVMANGGTVVPSTLTYTEVVKVLARRLKASPKKVRRQARTKFWDEARA